MKRYNGIEQDDEGAFVYYDDGIEGIAQACEQDIRAGFPEAFK